MTKSKSKSKTDIARELAQESASCGYRVEATYTRALALALAEIGRYCRGRGAYVGSLDFGPADPARTWTVKLVPASISPAAVLKQSER